MTDTAATPAPTLVQRAATAVVNAPSAVAAWYATLSPAINASIIAVVTAAVTFGMTVLSQRYVSPPIPKMVIQAADVPRPVPVVSVGDVDDLIGKHCAAVKEGLQVLLDRTAPKAVMKKTAGRSK